MGVGGARDPKECHGLANAEAGAAGVAGTGTAAGAATGAATGHWRSGGHSGGHNSCSRSRRPVLGQRGGGQILLPELAQVALHDLRHRPQ